MQIDSRENHRFKDLLKLTRSTRKRGQSGLMFLEGKNLVEEACSAGFPIHCLVISQSAMLDPGLRRIFEKVRCEEHLILADNLAMHLSDLPAEAGLFATMPMPKPASFPPDASCVLLDRIQDPGNLGNIFRTAAAAGFGHVAISRDSAGIWNPKTLRAGVGAHFRLNLAGDQDLESIVGGLGGMRLATSPHASRSIYEVEFREPLVWIFGSEGEGLSEQLRKQADLEVRVPMPGGLESLNVASTAAICLFESVRRRMAKRIV